MLIDTHCHIDAVIFQKPRQVMTDEHLVLAKQIVQDAEDLGVTKILNVGCDLQSSANSILLAENFENVFATVGLHPTDCNIDWKAEFLEIKKLFNQKRSAKIVAIGEIGLDFYHKPFNKQNQIDALLAQMDLAFENNLPISFHVRDAADDLLKVIEPFRKDLRAVIHCFQQSLDFAKVVTGWGFKIGIDGPINYPKNGEMREIVKSIGLQHIVLETDAPFLPPQQFRGKWNHPKNTLIIAQELASLFNLKLEDVAKITSKNAQDLFGF